MVKPIAYAGNIVFIFSIVLPAVAKNNIPQNTKYILIQTNWCVIGINTSSATGDGQSATRGVSRPGRRRQAVDALRGRVLPPRTGTAPALGQGRFRVRQPVYGAAAHNPPGGGRVQGSHRRGGSYIHRDDTPMLKNLISRRFSGCFFSKAFLSFYDT